LSSRRDTNISGGSVSTHGAGIVSRAREASTVARLNARLEQLLGAGRHRAEAAWPIPREYAIGSALAEAIEWVSIAAVSDDPCPALAAAADQARRAAAQECRAIRLPACLRPCADTLSNDPRLARTARRALRHLLAPYPTPEDCREAAYLLDLARESEMLRRLPAAHASRGA